MKNGSMENLGVTRWPYLLLGMVTLLFAGIIYAWSILKAPLGTEFGWSAADLALNFTLTMCCFCLSDRAAYRPSRMDGGLRTCHPALPGKGAARQAPSDRPET